MAGNRRTPKLFATEMTLGKFRRLPAQFLRAQVRRRYRSFVREAAAVQLRAIIGADYIV